MHRTLAIIGILVALPLVAQATEPVSCDYRHSDFTVKVLPVPVTIQSEGRFSPDGTQLALANANEILIFDIPSWKIVRTIPGPTEDDVRATTWTQNGKIFFSTLPAGSNALVRPQPIPLWVVDEDGTGLQSVEYSPEIPEGDLPSSSYGNYWAPPRISNGGTMVSLQRIQPLDRDVPGDTLPPLERLKPGSWEVWLMDVAYDDGDVRLQNARVVLSDPYFTEVKNFTKDDQRIVIPSTRGEDGDRKSLNPDVFTYDLTTEAVRRYTHSPTWEEDSDVLFGDGREGDAATFISDRDNPTPYHLSYSIPLPNNADWILVAEGLLPLATWTSHELYVTGPGGDRDWARRLTYNYVLDNRTARNPVWSPDGRRIAFLDVQARKLPLLDQPAGPFPGPPPKDVRRLLVTFDCE